MKTYSDIFLSKEEIEAEIENIKKKTFSFDLENKELFSSKYQEINDPKEVLEIKKKLLARQEIYTISSGSSGIMNFWRGLIFGNWARSITSHKSLESSESQRLSGKGVENTDLINLALEDLLFSFRKVSEEEMVIADKLKTRSKNTRGNGWKFR